MKKSKQPAPTVSREPGAGRSLKSNYSLLPALTFLAGAGVLVWLIVGSFQIPPTSVTEKPAPPNGIAAPPAPPSATTGSPAPDGLKPLPDATRQKLLGSWQRTDAEYAIEIRLINPDGVTDARYFNPFNQRSINVAKASLAERDGRAEFFMELRDVGYPGSTYTLRYDAQADQLVGTYFQAAMQQSFDVTFQRLRGQ